MVAYVFAIGNGVVVYTYGKGLVCSLMSRYNSFGSVHLLPTPNRGLAAYASTPGTQTSLPVVGLFA